jgi:hypothetical protein
LQVPNLEVAHVYDRLVERWFTNKFDHVFEGKQVWVKEG